MSGDPSRCPRVPVRRSCLRLAGRSMPRQRHGRQQGPCSPALRLFNWACSPLHGTLPAPPAQRAQVRWGAVGRPCHTHSACSHCAACNQCGKSLHQRACRDVWRAPCLRRPCSSACCSREAGMREHGAPATAPSRARTGCASPGKGGRHRCSARASAGTRTGRASGRHHAGVQARAPLGHQVTTWFLRLLCMRMPLLVGDSN